METWLAGVFEGGGAKGVAYTGALHGVLAKRCWFARVAGASAGAITAALVAAGLDPTTISRQAEIGLETLSRHLPAEDQPHRIRRLRAGLARLNNLKGFLRVDEFRDWLEACLASNRTERATGRIDFFELYDATRIELNVVAADLSTRQLIIFNWWATPRCSVTDAVLASSGIPFAFDAGQLLVPYNSVGEEDVAAEPAWYAHTLVDGGVWSNLPLFVFDDPGYLESVRLKREQIAEETADSIPADWWKPQAPDRLVGFLLQEEGEPSDVGRPAYRQSKLIGDDQLPRPIERQPTGASGDSADPEATRRSIRRLFGWMVERGVIIVVSVVTYFIAFLNAWGRDARTRRREALEASDAPSRWIKPKDMPPRWPEPAGRTRRTLLRVADGTTFVLQSPAGAIMAIAAAVWAAVLLIQTATGLVSGDRAVPDLILRSLLFAVLSAGILLSVGSLLLALLAAPFVAPHVRRFGYGLATTYATPGAAPPWAKHREDVIALPIPETLKTHSFTADPETIKSAIKRARRKTEEELDRMLAPGGPELGS